MKERIAECINILGNFCGKRDVESLTAEQLEEKYRIRRADVMVLFGGSILCGGDLLASAIKNKVAKKYIIVGGAGHTTETLRQKVHEKCPAVITDGLSEAEVFHNYLKTVYGLEADYLETKSTNCGNNITNLLRLLSTSQIEYRSIIICQDATMQRRMEAGLLKYIAEDSLIIRKHADACAGQQTALCSVCRHIINYATYRAKVVVRDNELRYSSDISGMWDMNRYVELLLGEIPRLSDTSDGYGPRGKNYIAHVDIPEEVEEAFETLVKDGGFHVRSANPLYASR